VLRCAHAYGLGGLWFTATVVAAEAGFVVGGGEQRLAPLLADDVGRAVAAIDDRRDRVAGTWHLEGPDVLTADELHALLDGDPEPEHLAPHEAARRLTTLLERPVTQATAELFAGGTPRPDAAAVDAARDLGLERTRLEDGLRRTARLADEVAGRVRRDA
jgi:hypothetical protein